MERCSGRRRGRGEDNSVPLGSSLKASAPNTEGTVCNPAHWAPEHMAPCHPLSLAFSLALNAEAREVKQMLCMENFGCFRAWKGGSQWASTSPCHILHLLDEAQREEFYTRAISCVHLSICVLLGDFCVRMNICLFCYHLIWSLSVVKFNHVQGDGRPKGNHLLGKLLGNTSRSAVLHKQWSHNYWECVSMSPEKSISKDKWCSQWAKIQIPCFSQSS